MLVTVTRFLPAVIALALAAQAQKVDRFFSGIVAEVTDDEIAISRIVRAKPEKHIFLLTPDTKIEGKLRVRVRVTVRYVSDDDGDTAKLIVVRAAQPATAKKK
jgi:pyruvate kinase